MAFAPWKIRREARRIGRQAVSLAASLYERLLATRLYDRTRDKHIRRTHGDVPEADRIAIYLLFPKDGVQPSHAMALDYLVLKGFAPLVVSNIPLTEADRATLAARSWRLIERPNVGYDFGGYRDGVLEIEDRLGSLQRLAFLNDSTWFPLPNGADWIADAEALDIDFAGAASNHGMERVSSDRFETFEWRYTGDRADFHYCSYALLLRERALRHSGFVRYWRNLPLSNNKWRTVRYGEIGFSQWARMADLTHGSTLDIAGLDDRLARCDHEEVAHIARHLPIIDDGVLTALRNDLLHDPKTDTATLRRLILFAAARQGASYALAHYASTRQGFPFLKKSPAWLGDGGLKVLLSAIDSLPDGPERETIRREIVAADPSRARRPDLDGLSAVGTGGS